MTLASRASSCLFLVLLALALLAGKSAASARVTHKRSALAVTALDGATVISGAAVLQLHSATIGSPAGREDEAVWHPWGLVAIMSLGLATGAVLSMPGAVNSAILAAI